MNVRELKDLLDDYANEVPVVIIVEEPDGSDEQAFYMPDVDWSGAIGAVTITVSDANE